MLFVLFLKVQAKISGAFEANTECIALKSSVIIKRID